MSRFERLNNADNVDSRCVPFQMLTGRQQQTLQGLADGLSHRQLGEKLGISTKTIDINIKNIGRIGIDGDNPGICNDYPYQTRLTLTSLIKDGIIQGYLSHELPEGPMPALNLNEACVAELLSFGLTNKQIARALYFNEKTIEFHKHSVQEKLQTTSTYHIIARTTYMKLSGKWNVRINKEDS